MSTDESEELITEFSKHAIEMHLASSWNCTDVFINEVVCATLEELNNAIEDDARCETDVYTHSEEIAAGREDDDDPIEGGTAEILADLRQSEDCEDAPLEMNFSSMDAPTFESLSESFSTGMTSIKDTVMTTVFLSDVDDTVLSAAGDDLSLDIISEHPRVEDVEPEELEQIAEDPTDAVAVLEESSSLPSDAIANSAFLPSGAIAKSAEDLLASMHEDDNDGKDAVVVLEESSFLPSEAIAKSAFLPTEAIAKSAEDLLASIYEDDNDGKLGNCECAFLPLLLRSKNVGI